MLWFLRKWRSKIMMKTNRPYHKTMAIKSRGESRQIVANRSIFHSKNNGDHFFENSRPIASQRAFQKTMAITLKVKFQLFLACTILVHAGQFFFFNLRYRGGLGHGLYPTKPLSNFISIVFRFNTLFLNLKGCQNPKIWQNSNIPNWLFVPFWHQGVLWSKYPQCEEIPLLDFSIQLLWGNILKIRRSFSVLNFLSK